MSNGFTKAEIAQLTTEYLLECYRGFYGPLPAELGEELIKLSEAFQAEVVARGTSLQPEEMMKMWEHHLTISVAASRAARETFLAEAGVTEIDGDFMYFQKATPDDKGSKVN